MALMRPNRDARRRYGDAGVVILALLACRCLPAFAVDKPPKAFRCSIKRPFPFASDKILKLPDNPLIDSKCVSFQTSPNANFFQVFLAFEFKGRVDAKRQLVAEIRLLDDQRRTLATQTYQCPDTRVDTGKQVMPGIRACSIQSIDLSHCDKKFTDRVAEVEFVFQDR